MFVLPAGWATAFYFTLFYVKLEKLALSDSVKVGFYNLLFFLSFCYGLYSY